MESERPRAAGRNGRRPKGRVPAAAVYRAGRPCPDHQAETPRPETETEAETEAETETETETEAVTATVTNPKASRAVGSRR